MAYRVDRIDHVNIQIPVGGEGEAEAFWMGILGFENRTKPADFAERGGRWFVNPQFEIHVSPERDFEPAIGAHVAMRVTGLGELVGALHRAGFDPKPTRGPDENQERYFVSDPFGNKLELIAAD